jgi:RNA recognition motif-containing protein
MEGIGNRRGAGRTRLPEPSESVTTGNRLYVGNLSVRMASEGLREAFAQSGAVTDGHIVADRESGRPRGFAFVKARVDF